MFTIKYHIFPEEAQKIAYFNNPADPELLQYPILAQLLLTFNDHEIGMLASDLPSPVGEELVGWWLETLNRVITHLNENKYITFLKPDSAFAWLEFHSTNDSVTVRYILAGRSTPFLSTLSDWFLVTDKPFFSDERETFIDQIYWEDKIGKDEFVSAITTASSSLINELLTLNPLFIHCKSFVALKEAYERTISRLC